MKRAVSMFAILAVIGLSYPAFAEIQPGRSTLTVMFGGYAFQGDENLKHSPVWNFRIGQDLTSNLSVEAAMDYIPTERKSRKRDFVDAYLYHLDALFHFMPDGKLVPFVAGGLGWRRVDGYHTASDADFIFNFGGGMKYFVTDRLAARVDIRNIVDFNQKKTYDNFMYTAGLTYHYSPMKMFNK